MTILPSITSNEQMTKASKSSSYYLPTFFSNKSINHMVRLTFEKSDIAISSIHQKSGDNTILFLKHFKQVIGFDTHRRYQRASDNFCHWQVVLYCPKNNTVITHYPVKDFIHFYWFHPNNILWIADEVKKAISANRKEL